MCTKPVNSVFRRSDWLLKPGIVCFLHFPAFVWILRVSFPPLLRKKGTIWCWLSTSLVYTKKIIHLSVGEERWIFETPLRGAANIIKSLNPPPLR